jgi:hypothetical protein
MQDIDQTKAAAHLSMSYIVGVLCEVLHAGDQDILDVLITMAVACANTGPAGRSNGVSEGDGRRGISRNAVSRAINVPLETVRRRTGALLARGVLEERPGGLVVVAPTGLAGDPKIANMNAQLLRQLYRSLKGQGIKLD